MSPETADEKGERVAKALARAGVASRREVERLIEAGRVALNGKVLTTPAIKVEPGDILTVDGAVVNDAEPVRVFRYHKPVGLMTTHNDPQGRPTVFEALPEGLPRLISIGRLDLNSEGLLLLTNDGGLARGLELPATGLLRRYRARARGRVTQERLDKLKDGITVEGVRYGPIEATLDKAKEGPQGANLWITVALAEGKNREVRRVLEALGLTVNRLIRLAYGPFALGTLEVGEIEEVGPRVIREQLADFVAEANMPSGDRPQFQKTSTPTPGPRRGAVEIERGNLRREDRPARYSPPNRRRGGGEIRNGPTGGAGASSTRASSEPVSGRGKPARAFDKRARPAADAPAKKDYKPGWAKPRPGKPVATKAAGARPSGVRTSGAKRSAAPGAARAGAPSSGPRGGGAASSSPRPSGPRGPNARAPTTGSPHAGGSRAPAGRPGRPSGPSGPKGAARPAGPRASGPPRPGGSKPGGFKPGGSRPGGGKPRGPKQR